MKFVTVKQKLLDLLGDDAEMLQKGTRRPHVLLVSLRYKGAKLPFAVPLRSNIPPSAPKHQYFPLPPRPMTKPGHRHGLHYIKMFPLPKEYRDKFWVGDNPSYVLYQSILDKHQARIVRECQAYLDAYSLGEKPRYSVDIDAALAKLSP